MNSLFWLFGQSTQNPTANPVLLHLANLNMNNFVPNQPPQPPQQAQGIPISVLTLPPPRPKLVFKKKHIMACGKDGILSMEITPLSYFTDRDLSSIVLVSVNCCEENDAWAILKHDNSLAVPGYYTDLVGIRFQGWPLEVLQTELLKVCKFTISQLICEPIPDMQEQMNQFQRRAEVSTIQNFYEPHPAPVPLPLPLQQFFLQQMLLPQVPPLPVQIKQEPPMEMDNTPQNNTQQNNAQNREQATVARSCQYPPTPPSNKSAVAADILEIPPPSPQSPLPALRSETLNTLMQPIWGQLAAQ